MNIDWFTLSAQIVNFIILVVLLKRFLYGPLRNIMINREEKVISRLEEAHQKLAEAEKKDENYQNKLAAFEAQKNEMMNEARREVERTKKEMLHQARHEIDIIKKNWEESLEAERDVFLTELHRQTSDNIVGLLDRLIRDLANSSLEEQAINKFIEQLQSLDKKEEKKTIEDALNKGGGVISVVSSFSLTDKQKERIEQLLEETFAIKMKCEFSVSPSLGFGIELRAKGWKMGWNAKIYLEDLKKNIDDLFNSDAGMSHRVTM